jgi:hypothetical protein
MKVKTKEDASESAKIKAVHWNACSLFKKYNSDELVYLYWKIIFLVTIWNQPWRWAVAHTCNPST